MLLDFGGVSYNCRRALFKNTTVQTLKDNFLLSKALNHYSCFKEQIDYSSQRNRQFCFRSGKCKNITYSNRPNGTFRGGSEVKRQRPKLLSV